MSIPALYRREKKNSQNANYLRIFQMLNGLWVPEMLKTVNFTLFNKSISFSIFCTLR